jgi:hypothetical protein
MLANVRRHLTHDLHFVVNHAKPFKPPVTHLSLCPSTGSGFGAQMGKKRAHASSSGSESRACLILDTLIRH